MRCRNRWNNKLFAENIKYFHLLFSQTRVGHPNCVIMLQGRKKLGNVQIAKNHNLLIKMRSTKAEKPLVEKKWLKKLAFGTIEKGWDFLLQKQSTSTYWSFQRLWQQILGFYFQYILIIWTIGMQKFICSHFCYKQKFWNSKNLAKSAKNSGKINRQAPLSIKVNPITLLLKIFNQF